MLIASVDMSSTTNCDRNTNRFLIACVRVSFFSSIFCFNCIFAVLQFVNKSVGLFMYALSTQSYLAIVLLRFLTVVVVAVDIVILFLVGCCSVRFVFLIVFFFLIQNDKFLTRTHLQAASLFDF